MVAKRAGAAAGSHPGSPQSLPDREAAPAGVEAGPVGAHDTGGDAVEVAVRY
jgi:hypothetical protein